MKVLKTRLCIKDKKTPSKISDKRNAIAIPRAPNSFPRIIMPKINTPKCKTELIITTLLISFPKNFEELSLDRV